MKTRQILVAGLAIAATAITVGEVLAQAPSNPTQQVIEAPGVVPLFRITVAGRTTAAINYRPRRCDTKISFAGTALLPQATGSATVSGEQGYMKISARFDKLVSASRFGREY